MTTRGGCDAVLLIGFGGPTNSTEIRPFLDRVLRGRPIPPDRYEEVVRHYEALGGYSPYNELTNRQVVALREALARRGVAIPVEVGLRNAAPFIDDAVAGLAAAGRRRVLGFILSAFRCEASWERYQADVTAACHTLRSSPPIVMYPEPWHTRPVFTQACAECVRIAMNRLDPDTRSRAELIFTAHSIPESMAAGAPYVNQLKESAAIVARAVGHPRWQLAFQSRSGSPRDRWLEPDIRTAIAANPHPKVVMPLGFLCDHVEVLYDLDIEAAAVADQAGITMVRAPALNDHPALIATMADVVIENCTPR